MRQWQTFKTFNALKSALGPSGPGKVWHHIVEQCQGKCTRAAFPSEMIHNTKNVVAVPKEVNQALNKFYSGTQPYTDGKTVRDWLNTMTFKEQMKFGKEQLERALKEYEEKHKDYIKP